MKRRIETAWAIWLAACIGSFAVLEAIAFQDRGLPTLSRTLRRWLGVDPRSDPWGTFSPVVFAAAGAWLSWHLARGQFEPWPPRYPAVLPKELHDEL